MKIKKTILLFAMATAAAIIAASLYFGVFKVISVNQDTYDFIKSIRQESEYYPLKGLLVNGETAYESANDCWWLCSLPENTDYNTLSFTFERNRFTLKLAIQKESYSSESLGQNQEIKLLAYSPRYYKEYSLHITTLPIFTLNTITDRPMEDEQASFNGMNAKVHIRGSSTKGYQKPGYKVTLAEKTSFLGMREDDDWVLYAGYNDQERVRNVFSTNLWYNSCAGNNSFGVINGYEYRYIELFHNGNYAGLYAIGYKPDQKQFEIGEGEYLYKKTQTKEYGDIFKLDGKKTESNADAAWNALNSGYIDDNRSLMDFWLFNNLCVAFDNTVKNYYMALKLDGEKLTAVYCPWDLDLTWGNYYNEELPNNVDVYFLDQDYRILLEGTDIPQLLENSDTDMIEKLKSRYRDLRSSQWSDETLEKAIDEYENMIFGSGAYRRDVIKWPDSTQLDNPDEGLSAFREYVLGRAKWMDKLMDAAI